MTFERAYFDRQYKYTATQRFSFYLRYAYWRRWMKRVAGPNPAILEIGSGLGDFVAHSPTAIGTDISAYVCSHLKTIKHAKIIRSSAELMPLRSDSMDVIFIFDVLEHLPNPAAAIQEAQRILKHGGRLVFVVPNPEGWGAKFQGADWIVGFGDPTHCSLLTTREWKDLVAGTGMRIQREGTDFLWSPPYVSRIPVLVQKAVLLPVHQLVNWAFGALPWSKGEMLVVEARKT